MHKNINTNMEKIFVKCLKLFSNVSKSIHQHFTFKSEAIVVWGITVWKFCTAINSRKKFDKFLDVPSPHLTYHQIT